MNSNITIKESIQNLIKNGKMENALELLNKLRVKEYENEIVTHISKFRRLKSEDRLGTLDYKEKETKINLLTKNILELTDDISKIRSDFNKSVSKYFESKKGYEVTSETLFGIKSNSNLGFNDNFYLQRDYLDKDLRTSILFNQNILLTGGPGSGKSRTILELIKKYLTKYTIVLPVIDIEEVSGFESLDKMEKAVVIYDDINLFFTQNFENHYKAIDKIAFYNNLSIIASYRNSEIKNVKEVLGKNYKLFKQIEIKGLNKEENKTLSEILKSKEIKIKNIGDFFE